MVTPAVEILQVSYKVPVGLWAQPKWLLQDVSLTLAPGEALALMGENGAGKTTLFKSMLGALRPHTGSIRLFGLPAHAPKARTHLGFMPERSPFSPALRAHEILWQQARLAGMSQNDARAACKQRLEQVGLAHTAHLPTRAFSKGMLQRLALAQALVGKPRLLLLDEPMSGLDPQGRMHVRDLLQALRDAGTTLLFSSHDAGDVELLADTVVLLQAGRIVQQGPTDEVLGAHGAEIEIMVAGPICTAHLQQKVPRCRAAAYGAHTLCIVPKPSDANQAIDIIRQGGGHIVRVTRRPVAALKAEGLHA